MEKSKGAVQHSGKKKYPIYKTVGYMVQTAWNGHKSVLWLCIAMVFLAVAENLIGLFIAPMILERVEQAAPLQSLIGTILGFVGALIGCRALAAYLDTNIPYERIEVRRKVLDDIHAKTAQTSYPNTSNPYFLELQEKAFSVTNSDWAASQRIWPILTDLLKNLLGFGIYLALLSHLDLILMAIVLVTAVISYFINRWCVGWEYRNRDQNKKYMARFKYIDKKNTDFAMAKDVRIFDMADWLSRVYHDNLNNWLKFNVKSEQVLFGANVIDVVIGILRSAIFYGYLIAMTLREGWPASQFLLYFTAITGFASWVSGLLEQFSNLQQQGQELSNVLEYLDTPEPFRFEDGEPLTPDSSSSYELRLDHVSFRYPGAEEDTIHDLSLTVKPGEKLAIVGLNGAGKTTLVKLMGGFLDPTEGAVLLNGIDIRCYNRRDYYKHFAAVFQQFSIISSTFAENIAQTSENIDRTRVEHCLEQAGLLDKINELGGIDTHMGKEVYEDGVTLSGGETQRLMLARALYKDAPMILLDEPTAALDPIAEDDIYHRYSDLTKGRTSVYISHRLASTRFCDRIILLKDGHIAEEGTHESLLAAGGSYAEMFEVQRHYYQEGAMDDEQG